MTNQFHNQPDHALVDEFGDLDLQIKTLEKKRDALKEELKARFSDVPLIGHRWEVSVSESESETIDSKRLREDLGEEIIAPYKKTRRSQTVRVKPAMRLGDAA